MRLSPRRKRLIFAAVILIALALFAVEAFVFSPAVRSGAIDVLEWAGADASIAALLDDDDMDVRQAAIDALVRRGELAVPALVARVDRPEAPGRSGAAYVLGRMGSPAARPALPVLRRWMCEDPNDANRENFAQAFGRIVRDDPAAIADLIGLLETGDEHGRVAAAEALGFAEEGAAGAAPALARALRKDPASEVRQEAAEAIGRIGPAGRTVVADLITALDDPEPAVRSEVNETLHIMLAKAQDDPALAARIQAAVEQARLRWSAGPPKD
jgi:HEAT repeat protein